MPEPIRVLIVDDHAVVRQGLKSFLRTQDDIVVVGEAADGEEALTQLQRLRPDVILMDLVMPGVDGIAATRRIHEASPDTKVIVLTSFTQDEQVIAAVKAGASAYLLKDVRPQELGQAIRAVFGGDVQLHPYAAAKLMQEVAASGTGAAKPDALTNREGDVLRLLARGMSNKEIASTLGVAEKTVKTHVSHILHKLNLADRTQAALYAVREHLADSP